VLGSGGEAFIFPSTKYPDFPLSEAVAYEDVLYLSGDLGTDSSGKLVGGGIGPESRQTMENVKATLGRHGGEPRKIVTDKLRSYGVAHRELLPESIHVTDQYANNRAEQSREPTRRRERGMRKFKSIKQAQRFLGTHAAVPNFFNLGRHLVRAQRYRDLRMSAFVEWSRAVV
jgi:enamine deaminase RidA (YjgF/YER057c/UK114 family)